MKKRFGLFFVLMTAAIVGYVKSPAVRAIVNSELREWGGWTTEARREDPAGFVEHVKEKLEDDLLKMQGSKNALAAESLRVADTKNELQALKSHADALAETFRAEWQSQSFPIVVCRAAYTKDQAESQVQLLLEQVAQYEESLERVGSAEKQSDERIRSLTLQIDRTRTSLALLDTQKELLKAEKLTTEGEALVAQVDSLLNQNEEVIAGTPVRSVEELLAAGGTSTETAMQNNLPAIEFLNGQRSASKPVVNDAATIPQDTNDETGSAGCGMPLAKPVYSQY